MQKPLPRPMSFKELVATPGSPSARIVTAFASRGEASAADLASDAQMSRSSVSAILSDLREAGVVLDVERRQGGMGRPTQLHMLNPAIGTCAGVLLGLGEIRISLCDVSHRVLTDERLVIHEDYSPDDAAEAVAATLQAHTKAIGLSTEDLIGIGLAVSAPVAADGSVMFGSILPSWRGVPIGSVFQRRLGCPVHVDNESHCGALSEMTWGAARGEPDFVMFKFDLGTGGAIVMDGILRRGANGCGGEFGHLTIDPLGALCKCGNRGCLETVVGGSHLLQLALEATGHHLTLPEFVKEARSGHVGFRRLVEDAGSAAGLALGMIGSALNPPLFLITGGLAQAGDLFLDPMRAAFERHTLCRPSLLAEQDRTRILPGQFLSNDNVLGAAALVLRQVSRVA
jgi:predicted NBD/HSP70 family sugar kinase